MKTLKEYNESVWETKLRLMNENKYDRSWRGRWDFALKYTPENSKVLDVGCGDGMLGKFLTEKKSCEVFGIDISEIALKEAEKRGLKTFLCDLSCDRYPFDNETFDVAIFACTLEHVIESDYALRETGRVLKHGGLILLTLPNCAHISNRISFLLGKMPREFLHSGPGEGAHFQFFNYTNEFEDRIRSKIDGLQLVHKEVGPKNPRAFSPFKLHIIRVLENLLPNLFGAYSHYLIKKIKYEK